MHGDEMFVTIMRHGEAHTSAGSDAERPLTRRGRNEVQYGGQQLLSLCSRARISPPRRLLHSPYLRTLETADIVGGVTGLEPQSLDELAPGHGPEQLESCAALTPEDDDDHILLISHQPLVSLLVSRWSGNGGSRYVLSPGGFTTLSAEIMLARLATHEFSALPPNYGALA